MLKLFQKTMWSQLETNDEETFQPDQNSPKDEIITDSTEEGKANEIGENTHGKEKNIECGQCNKRFSNKTKSHFLKGII